MENKPKFGTSRALIAIFAFIGLGIMSYLSYIVLANKSSFCDLSTEVSCDVVTTSIYSTIFGIPISLMGLAFFALILYMVFSRRKFEAIFLVTLFMFVPSLYFTMTEILFIKSFCILCETSKTLMLAILITSLTASEQKTKKILQMAIPVIIAGVISAGVIFFAQTGTVAKKDYSELVSCLNENDVVYYKSKTCGNCRRQEALLGEAYKKLNSVECHPEGENSQAELCLEKDITKTPTFLIEQGGKEIKRVIGLQKVEKLAEFGGCLEFAK